MYSATATTELPVLQAGSPLRSDAGAKVQSDALGDERLRGLLTRRLQHVSLALAVMTSSLLLIKMLSGLWETVWLFPAGVLATGVWGFTCELFQARRLKDESSLRRGEVGVFLSTVASLTCLIFANLEATAGTGELQKYLLTIREAMFVSVVLILVYGLLIPNHSRRVALVATGLAAVPAGTVAISLLTHARAFGNLPGSVVLQFAFENLLLLTAAVSCTTVGTAVRRRIQERNTDAEELGPYTLLSPQGSGGMGDVFLAEHRLLKRYCAIKLIHSDKAGDSRMKKRFEREVKATAALTHPNTVEVYDYGTTSGGRFFYVMEFLEGLNLQQFVDRFGPMSSGRVVFVLKQICSALHEAHCAGLVHRDIKPSNIFLSERGQMYDIAKLLDFGLVQAALTVGLKRVNTQIQGSPAFMCPEQASGQEPDCRGDLYSLGAVAYFLLTGHPPFQDENPVMLVVAHATTAVPDFAEVGVDVPDDLAAIVMQCLAKKQDDRYVSPRDLLLALESCDAHLDWDWQQAEAWWMRHGAGIFRRSGELPSAEMATAGPQTSTVDQIDAYHKTLIFEDGLPAAGLSINNG